MSLFGASNEPVLAALRSAHPPFIVSYGKKTFIAKNKIETGEGGLIFQFDENEQGVTELEVRPFKMYGSGELGLNAFVRGRCSAENGAVRVENSTGTVAFFEDAQFQSLTVGECSTEECFYALLSAVPTNRAGVILSLCTGRAVAEAYMLKNLSGKHDIVCYDKYSTPYEVAAATRELSHAKSVTYLTDISALIVHISRLPVWFVVAVNKSILEEELWDIMLAVNDLSSDARFISIANRNHSPTVCTVLDVVSGDCKDKAPPSQL